MGKLESLVRVAQIAVGIDMQDAELRVPRAQRPDQPVGGRMVAADEPHRLAGVEPA